MIVIGMIIVDRYDCTIIDHFTMPSDVYLGKVTLLVIIYLFLESINKAAEAWGIDCKRYEIRKYYPPLFILASTKVFICKYTRCTLQQIFQHIAS